MITSMDLLNSVRYYLKGEGNDAKEKINQRNGSDYNYFPAFCIPI